MKKSKDPVKAVTVKGTSASQDAKLAHQRDEVVPQDAAESSYDAKASGGSAHKHIHQMHMSVARHGKH